MEWLILWLAPPPPPDPYPPEVRYHVVMPPPVIPGHVMIEEHRGPYDVTYHYFRKP